MSENSIGHKGVFGVNVFIDGGLFQYGKGGFVKNCKILWIDMREDNQQIIQCMSELSL